MIYSRSPGWQSPQEQKNVSPAPYPWRKLYSCKNKTFLGPTFPFPWSSGLSSLAALGRQLSCRSRKVKSCPSESLVPPWFHSFIGNLSGIYILTLWAFVCLFTFICLSSYFFGCSSSSTCISVGEGVFSFSRPSFLKEEIWENFPVLPFWKRRHEKSHHHTKPEELKHWQLFFNY